MSLVRYRTDRTRIRMLAFKIEGPSPKVHGFLRCPFAVRDGGSAGLAQINGTFGRIRLEMYAI
jgi:hypothetical protein